jgi:hypothetical protein
MADLYLMNGTNSVGNMQGTNQVGGGSMNGTNQVGGGLNGGFYATSDVVPGLNGLTSGITLNGVDCCDLNPYDMELNGIDDQDPDADAIKLALMYGDEDIIDAYENGELNGLKEILAARKARIASESPEEAAARKARRGKLLSTVLSVASLSPVGGGLATKLKGKLDQALAVAQKAGAALDAVGVVANEKALATRAVQETEAGLPDDMQEEEKPGLMAKWNGLSPVAKGAIIGSVALGGFLLYRALSKKGKKRR